MASSSISAICGLKVFNSIRVKYSKTINGRGGGRNHVRLEEGQGSNPVAADTLFFFVVFYFYFFIAMFFRDRYNGRITYAIS